jgi:hypothetical protein
MSNQLNGGGPHGPGTGPGIGPGTGAGMGQGVEAAPAKGARQAAANRAAGCGCAVLALPFFILFVAVAVAFFVGIPGSVVAAVLVAMGRHGSGPLRDYGWVHGTLWQAFGGPVCCFGVCVYGAFECLDNWTGLFGKSGSKESGPGAPAAPQSPQYPPRDATQPPYAQQPQQYPQNSPYPQGQQYSQGQQYPQYPQPPQYPPPPQQPPGNPSGPWGGV